MDDMNKITQKVLNTKVSAEFHSWITALAKRRRITVYNLLQVILESFGKYFTDDEVLTEHTINLVNGFVDFRLAKDSFMFCQPSSSKCRQSINECIVFIKQENKPRSRMLLIHNSDGTKQEIQYTQNYNDDVLLLTFMRSFAPELINKLQAIQRSNNLLSLSDTLKFCVKEQLDPNEYNVIDDIKEMFSDNARYENTGLEVCDFVNASPPKRRRFDRYCDKPTKY